MTNLALSLFSYGPALLLSGLGRPGRPSLTSQASKLPGAGTCWVTVQCALRFRALETGKSDPHPREEEFPARRLSSQSHTCALLISSSSLLKGSPLIDRLAPGLGRLWNL